ncbi:hypothetical protein ACHAXA_009020 [Cyclostephanos tholiformis]|uniref:Uncharacterized protein n=1 Tax=Cyclostephanos tholiformis TaxID=382380 RepID=A0ABD3RFF5_9STRA
MANDAAVTAIVEDEPIHEIYASLVEGNSYRNFDAVPHPESLRGTAAASSATSDVLVSTSLSSNNPYIYVANQEAAVIPNNFDDCPTPSASQFMSVYRKSCREVQRCRGGKVNSGGKQNTGRHPCSRDNASSSPSVHLRSEKLTGVKNSRSHSPRTKEVHATTTKPERKRQAKREHERHMLTEKRIRMMLRLDISEEDELLLMRLTG